MENEIQISDLKFDSIRESLISYMKTKDSFKDYDFKGSAISTLIDLLAYNTFYYGYYANMVANEMFLDTAKLEDSLISLTKPLGYVLTNSKSAYTNVRLSNLNGVDYISEFSTFRGYDANGNIFYFFNLNEVQVNTVITGETTTYETDFFPVYESKFLIFEQQVEVDLDSQQFLISGIEVDPTTIVIDVIEQEDRVKRRWDNYLANNDLITGPNSRLFFIERKKNGYMVLFGKNSESEESFASVGKQIQQGDVVLISYLTASGEIANNISNIEFISDNGGNDVLNPNTQTVTLFATKNGRSSPNLDSVRFFAPKNFASQNRLVTKNDYYAILNELGYGSGGNPDFDFKVFGGEEATPPTYGRVFVSILDLNPQDLQNFTEINQINEIMSILKSKSVVTILPEYMPPTEIPMKIIANCSMPGFPQSTINASLTVVKNALLSAYGTKKFNNNILEQQIKDIIRRSVSGIVVLDAGVFVYAKPIVKMTSGEIKTINLKNPINTNVEGNVRIEWTDSKIRDVYSSKKLFKYNKNNETQLISSDPVGEVNYEQGIITLYPQIGPNENQFEIEVRCKDDNFYAKDEFVLSTPISNIQVSITQT